uniref:Uncharacterized protein n=1 Tax=Cucumis melo TaxID=3656 RepID=A0A9I9ECF4_CUCME
MKTKRKICSTSVQGKVKRQVEFRATRKGCFKGNTHMLVHIEHTNKEKMGSSLEVALVEGRLQQTNFRFLCERDRRERLRSTLKPCMKPLWAKFRHRPKPFNELTKIEHTNESKE